MICTNFKNVNQGNVRSYGKVNGYLFSTKKPAALVESAAKDIDTWTALMQADADAGRLMILKRIDVMEPGEPEIQTAPSNNGAVAINKDLPTHIYDLYADDCGLRSVLGTLGNGVTVFGYQITDGGFLRGQKTSTGTFAPIELYMYAHEMEAGADRPDTIRLQVTPREDFKQRQFTLKPDFDVNKLEAISEVLISNLVADETADTVVFDATYCNGCAATDPTLTNYIFLAGTTEIVPTDITQSGSTITATFAAAAVTGTISVYLDAPSTTAENYESEIYTVVAA